jgi:glycosyltransferase involved in cell wall biosynthesis
LSERNGADGSGAGLALSVITAVADRPEHRLAEIHGVLAASAADWEWLIQLDGDVGASLPPELTADPRTRVERNGRQLGIAATRNRALSRSRAPLLLNVDSDDVPTPAALSELPTAFEDPSIGLAFGDWVECWPDRDPWTSPPRFQPGRLEPATLARIWAAERWVPLHLAGAMWRTDAVLAAGGWSATAGGSDIGLLLGVDAQWASFYVAATTFTYHHHAEQVTASDAYRAQFELDMRFLERRQQALERLARSHMVRECRNS